MQNKEHIYLLVIGVDPDQQGHGYGGQLISHLLQRVDEKKMETYLECTKQKNISFYQHFGFKLVEELKIGPHPAPSIYLMRRPAVDSNENDNDANNNDANNTDNNDGNDDNNHEGKSDE